MKRRNIFLMFLAMGLFTAGSADDTLPPKKITFSGHVAFEAGQFMRGSYFKIRGITYDHRWLSTGQCQLSANTVITPFLKVSAGLEVDYLSPFYTRYQYPGLAMAYYNAYMTEAKGTFSLEKGDHSLEIEIGKFDFKYNPDSRNLGEYLFRSTPYPQTLWTDFDYSMVRLLGFQLHHTWKLPALQLDQQLVFYTATDHFPLWDWTPVYIANVNINKTVEVGAGISLYHLLSVNSLLTRPTMHDTFIDNVPTYERKFYIDANGDSLQVPFSGTMLMGRISVDPKRLFLPEGDNGIFGNEDLRLYSEASILGLKDYPMTDTNNPPAYAFDKISQRIPIMIGFNIPTFKALDVLSGEMEYWGTPWPNSLEDVIKVNQTSPGLQKGNGSNYNPADYVYHWKWSVYLKKTMFNSFQIIGQVANDHYFTHNPGDQLSSVIDFEQAFRKNGDWWWMLKFRFLF
jgi:hypothetical protein